MTDANDTDNYPLLGERFENVDSRSEGRVIKAWRPARSKEGYMVPGVYLAKVEADPLNPSNVGHLYQITAYTLENEKLYRKISH